MQSINNSLVCESNQVFIIKFKANQLLDTILVQSAEHFPMTE